MFYHYLAYYVRERNGQAWAEFSALEVAVVCFVHSCCYQTKRPNLKLKTWSKKLLGPFPLETALPEYCYDLDGRIKLS